MIVVTKEHLGAMRAHGEQDYPFECCGLMLGRFDGSIKRVLETYPISNAREKSLEVIGFYHSHPDDVAVPSQYDLEHAWPTYSYIVMSVKKARTVSLRSWEMESDRSRFNEEEIVSEVRL